MLHHICCLCRFSHDSIYYNYLSTYDFDYFLELGPVKLSDKEHQKHTSSQTESGLLSCCNREHGQEEPWRISLGRSRKKIFMGFELLLDDSGKREVKISTELRTFTEEFCSLERNIVLCWRFQ